MHEGTVNFLGQELTRSVLVFNGYDKTVLYGAAPETNSQLQVCPHDLPAGEDWLD
jgi:hypothetical protein